MKILVTGGTGFIGSHTVVELLNEGYDVVIVDNLYTSKELVVDRIETITGRRPTFYKVDVTDRAALTEVFEKELPTPVREAARRSAARVVRALRRDASIVTEIVTRKDGTKAAHMAFMDDDVPVFGFDVMVLDDEQGKQFTRNFRDHAETIYKEVLNVLLADYDEPDEFDRRVASGKTNTSEESPK